MFCDLQELTINLGKIKVMIFNCLKKFLSDFYFYFKREVEVSIAYTYLGVKFSKFGFKLRQALQPPQCIRGIGPSLL
jgi:hypothetical protein